MEKLLRLLIALLLCGTAVEVQAGSVTVVDNGPGVVLSNGIVSVTIQKTSAQINSFLYQGYDILTGGYRGGSFYWSWNMPNYQNPANCAYTLTADPATNSGAYAEVKLHMPWSGAPAEAAMDVDIYYALTSTASGVYAAAKLRHPAAYPFKPGGEWRMAAYPGATFDWLSVDAARNQLMPSGADEAAALPVPGAPKEVMRLTTGPFANHYECKYDYSADFGAVDAWGWSSTTRNIGVWMTVPSREYYPGGPLKRELTGHATPVLLNMLGGTHYGMGAAGDVAAGEDWQKVYGPYLIYCNQVPAGTANAPQALWQDAIAQAKAEQAQWPYPWFTEPAYAKADGRGAVTGRLVLADAPAPGASAANMWVGVAIPQVGAPDPSNFQLWAKNYQFWAKTDAAGNFSLPNVLPGVYTLYAFGPGAAGQLTRPAAATVVAGRTTALGPVAWTPERVGPTVWEIGVPDRTAQEFRHGTDYWVGGTYPSPNWAKFMDYPAEFPQDVVYTVGQSNWATDWNYVQPYNLVTTSQAAAPQWKVRFNLSDAPPAGSSASVYVAVAAAYNAALVVAVNGTNVTSPATGVAPPNPSDATIRKGIHGAFGELRFTFPAGLLQAGANEVSLSQRRVGGDIQYDYLRLEASATRTVLATTGPAAGSTAASECVVYPNPADTSITVKFYAPANGTADCAILDAKGSVVRALRVKARPGSNLFTTSTAGLAPGLYIVRVTCQQQTQTARFTK